MAVIIKIVRAFILLCVLKNCSCLNASQYRSMPPSYALDPWSSCVSKPIWKYCIAHFSLTSNQPSALLDMIHEYSADTQFRLNHTQIHRGICVTDSCKDLLKEYKYNKTLDLNGTLEACQNRTIWRDYELQANLEQVRYCKSSDDNNNLDPGDVTMIVIYCIIIALNIAGSVYDKVFCKDGKGNKYLLAFSIFRNYKRLIASADNVPDPRLLNFKSFNGIRTIMIILVINSHVALLVSSTFTENTVVLETRSIRKYINTGGTVSVQIFFLMSGLLASHNFQLEAERRKFTWLDLPRGLLLRWLRLTPTYALVLGTVATLVRHMGSGPLWDLNVVEESNLCRKYWWSNIFYFNNYIRENNCLPQAWYIACDMQLFTLGIFICLIAKTPRQQKWILSIVTASSFIIIGAVTYFLNLDAVVLSSPEQLRDLFVHDDTFRLSYITGHTNISAYVIGLSAGFFIYYCQQKNIDFTKYKRYGGLFLMVIPMMVLLSYLCVIFYSTEQPSIVKALYASLHKFIFYLLVTSALLAMIFKVETIQATVLEWRGVTWIARISYCAFLIHNIIHRPFVGSKIHPVYISSFDSKMMLISSLFYTFLISAILWLMMENPIHTMVKLLIQPSRSTKTVIQEQKIPPMPIKEKREMPPV